MNCVTCKSDLGTWKERAAWLSYSVLGNEHTATYWFCKPCNVYTIEMDEDRFLGEESSWTVGPVRREEGDATVAKFKSCPDPGEKRCKCPIHQEFER